MLKLVGFIFGLICFATLAYVLHVPLLTYWTAPSNDAELNAYIPLSGEGDGQSYKIEQIVNGNALTGRWG